MELSSKIYSKTGKGTRAVSARNRELSADALRLLAHIDGKTDAATIMASFSKLPENLFQVLLSQLESAGYIRLMSAPTLDWADDKFDYRTAIVVDELSPEDYAAFVADTASGTKPGKPASSHVRLETEAEASSRLDQEAKAAAERLAREEEAARQQAVRQEEARRQALMAARLEAERKVREAAVARFKAEAEARNRAEEAEKAAAERRAAEEQETRRKAEEAARLEAERKAREAAERKASEAEQARLRAEAEARARAEEAERRARAAEEGRLKLEAEARARAEEAARLEAERRAREEAERQERAAQEARRQAEEHARLEEERKRREEAERLARAAEEARLKAEVEARARAEEAARLEEERRARDAEQTRLLAEAEARARAEAAAQLEAERLAREATLRREREEQEARRQAEQAARLEAERKAREHAEHVAREAEEARQKAEAEAHARAEEAERRAHAAEQARLQAEEEARAIAESAARLEAERKSRDEEESRRRAEEAAKQDAERQARAEARRKAREDKAARRKAAAEARAQAKDEARLQAERLAREARERQAREAEEARQKAEAEARALAEEAARLEAERKAREEAELKARVAEEARLRAEAEARAKAEETARLEAERMAIEEAAALRKAEAEVRAATERTAREEARRQAREEKLARRRAKAEARARAKQEARQLAASTAMETTARRGTRRTRAGSMLGHPGSWATRVGRGLFLYTPLALVLLLGLLQFVNLGTLLGEPMARLATASLGEPVRIKQVHASLLPRPRLVLAGVAVGADADTEIGVIRVRPAAATLFDKEKSLESLEIEQLTIHAATIGRQLQWLRSAAGGGRLKIQRITLKQATFQLPGLEPAVFDGRLDLLPSGDIGNLELVSADRSLTIQLTPQNGGFELSASAHSWQPPLGTALQFSEFTAKGTASGQRLRFSQIEGRLYGGTVQGQGSVDWSGQQPSVSGNFKLDNVSLSSALAAIGSSASVEGVLKASATFAGRPAAAARLTETAEVQASFVVTDGRINGVDLAASMLAGSNRSPATRFDRLSGSLLLRNGVYHYRQLALDTDKFHARGQLDIQPDREVTGKVSAELVMPSRRMQSNVGLSGKLGEVRLQ